MVLPPKRGTKIRCLGAHRCTQSPRCDGVLSVACCALVLRCCGAALLTEAFVTALCGTPCCRCARALVFGCVPAWAEREESFASFFQRCRLFRRDQQFLR
jgi:hypothetical protein